MIREYEERDEKVVKTFLVELQDYLIEYDDQKLLKRFEEDGTQYLENLLSNIQKGNGKILIYEDEGTPIGFVAGYIEEVDKVDQLMSNIQKPGYVAELFVQESSRGKGFGKALMSAMENYFRECGCDFVTVTVDRFNASAVNMYASNGFTERDILMLKKL